MKLQKYSVYTPNDEKPIREVEAECLNVSGAGDLIFSINGDVIAAIAYGVWNNVWVEK